MISRPLILVQLLLLVLPSPGLLGEVEDDVDQEYNRGDADDTYTLSQESKEDDVLVVPAKSKEQQEKEKKRNKFLEVLSFFSDLLTDEKYKEFQMPGEVKNEVTFLESDKTSFFCRLVFWTRLMVQWAIKPRSPLMTGHVNSCSFIF